VTTEPERVRTYFERCADRFDGFYRQDTGGPISRFAHAVFREPGLRRRFEAAARIIGEPEGKRILDLGCGSGVYAVYYAARGADVLGIDFSSRMIELHGPFDATLMMGVFDYVPAETRDAVLQRARDLTNGPVIASFPKLFAPLQVPLRKLWLARQGAPVYFYTRSRVEALAARAGMQARFHDCGPIWTVEFRRRGEAS
jgi:SAM-dependent methyltransferase